MTDATVDVFCECDGICGLSVRLPVQVAREIQLSGNVVIVDGCSTGPSPGDVLVEEREGYSIYKPAQ